MLRRPLFGLALWLAPAILGAQGIVQAPDPRRPPPLEPPPECELWRGHIAGNDPSAEATLQLCTTGDAVEGVFLWSSLESGWDRRRFSGQWMDSHQRLVLHDTAMVENHPANGWRLCMADRYDLRRVNEGELSGEFWSNACDDHGTIRITRSGPIAPPEAPPPPAPAPATPRPSAVARRRSFGCSTAPGGAGSRAGGWVLGVAALAALSRCRGSRARR